MTRRTTGRTRLLAAGLVVSALGAGLPLLLAGTASSAPGDTLAVTPGAATPAVGACQLLTATTASPMPAFLLVRAKPRSATQSTSFCSVDGGGAVTPTQDGPAAGGAEVFGVFADDGRAPDATAGDGRITFGVQGVSGAGIIDVLAILNDDGTVFAVDPDEASATSTLDVGGTAVPSPTPTVASPSPTAEPSPSTVPTSPSPSPTTAPGPTPDEPGMKRLAGPDRYATAAEIVQDSFPAGPVPVLFVATGEDFADALAGGPAADVMGGPVLPVARAGIPAPIRAELDRLDPARIVILGGPGAVSDAIATELQSFTSGSVTRMAGTNRYDTAAKVAQQVFTAPVPQVLIATGLGFADALAGGAVGAKTNSPVLLVAPNSLPAETAEALRQLRPRNIAVLGGTAAVSDDVVKQLQSFTTDGVTRLSGDSRYTTATRIARVFWPQTSNVVYLATGRNFPDALAGIPAAGLDQAPLLLTEPHCLPTATKQEMDRLQPATVVVLGGTATVSDAAATGSTLCSVSSPPPSEPTRPGPGDTKELL